MKKIVIEGGNKISGEVEISGAKNAALPIIASCLLNENEVKVSNIPHVVDVSTMINLILNLGGKVRFDCSNNGRYDDRIISVDCSAINKIEAPYELVKQMRASILVLGPLLARFGKAIVSLPGGCTIGNRPIDIHLKAFEKMGAEISIENGYVTATAPKSGLRGAEIFLEKPSVGATENIMMAASIINDTTIIRNAALEPEIVNLQDCLVKMGANVKGAGTSDIIISPVSKLKSACLDIIPDRIEMGTYVIASAMTDGELLMRNADYGLISHISGYLDKAGIEIKDLRNGLVKSSRISDKILPIDIETGYYPEFPTDMQAQMLTLMTIANGKSIITENIFENRLMHVMELRRMGANLEVDNNRVIINGVGRLTGASVMATDLRASVSLVIAALFADGQTIIDRMYHLERGYENLVEKLRICGANIGVINS